MEPQRTRGSKRGRGGGSKRGGSNRGRGNRGGGRGRGSRGGGYVSVTTTRAVCPWCYQSCILARLLECGVCTAVCCMECMEQHEEVHTKEIECSVCTLKDLGIWMRRRCPNKDHFVCNHCCKADYKCCSAVYGEAVSDATTPVTTESDEEREERRIDSALVRCDACKLYMRSIFLLPICSNKDHLTCSTCMRDGILCCNDDIREIEKKVGEMKVSEEKGKEDKVEKEEESKVVVSEGEKTLGVCTICMSSRIDSVMLNCGHLATCYQCAVKIHKMKGPGGGVCPICKGKIARVVKTYLSA